MNEADDIKITVAEPDGEERQVDSVDQARKVIWARMKPLCGSDLDLARGILLAITGKSSFHDLDPVECFDLSYLLLEENRDVLKDELSEAGAGELARRLG